MVCILYVNVQWNTFGDSPEIFLGAMYLANHPPQSQPTANDLIPHPKGQRPPQPTCHSPFHLLYLQRFHFPLSVSVVHYTAVFGLAAVVRWCWEFKVGKRRKILDWPVYFKRVLPTGKNIRCLIQYDRCLLAIAASHYLSSVQYLFSISEYSNSGYHFLAPCVLSEEVRPYFHASYYLIHTIIFMCL